MIIVLFSMLWLCRVGPAGEPPSPRAAHAVAAVGTMVVFQVLSVVAFGNRDFFKGFFGILLCHLLEFVNLWYMF